MSQYNSQAASYYLHNYLQKELSNYGADNEWTLMHAETQGGATWYDFSHPTWGIASIEEQGSGFSCETEIDTLQNHRNYKSQAWTADCQKVVEAVRELKQKTAGQVLQQSLNSLIQSPLVINIENALWAQTRIHLVDDFDVLEDTPETVNFELNSSHAYGQEIIDVLMGLTTGFNYFVGHKTFSLPLNGGTVRDCLTNFIGKGTAWNTEQCGSVNQGSVDLTFFTEATSSYNSNKEASAYDATVFLNGLEKYTGNINILFGALEGSQKWPWLAKAIVKKLKPTVNMSYLYDEFEMDMPTNPEVGFTLNWPTQTCIRYSRIFNTAGEDAQLFTCDMGSVTPHPTYPGTVEEWVEDLNQYGFDCDYDGVEHDEDDELEATKSYGDQTLMTEAIKNDKYTAIQKLLNKNAPEVAEGLKHGRFLVEAIMANNLDGIEALMNAGAQVNSKVVSALIQKMPKFDAFVQPILEKSQSVELLTACVNWQMGLNPSAVNPRQRDWIFNTWKNHAQKDDILVKAATHSDTAWRVAPWKNELQALATTCPALFFASINNAVNEKKYNFVRETVRALKIPPSQIAINGSNLLAYSENLKSSIKAGGKITSQGHPHNMSIQDILNNPALFGIGQRPAARQVDPTESFTQAIKIMEAQFTLQQKSSIKRSP